MKEKEIQKKRKKRISKILSTTSYEVVDVCYEVQYRNNDTTAQYQSNGQNISQDVRFFFTYDVSEQSYGYLDEQGSFKPFSSGQDTSDATAYSEHVLAGKTFYARGEKYTGNIVSRSASSENVTTTKTYQSGYYPNNWTVTGGIDTSDATATADRIFSGYTAYVNGVKITGTYSRKLSKTTATNLSETKKLLSSTTIPNYYAIFAGGFRSTNTTYNDFLDTVNAYNSSLSKSTPSTLSRQARGIGATCINNYALFAGGYYSRSGSVIYDKVDTYNTSLSRSTAAVLSLGRYQMGSATIGNFALFAGGDTGQSGNQYSNIVDRYSTSLVRASATALSQARSYICSAIVGNYALFAGGATTSSNGNWIYHDTVDVYNTSLSKSIATGLSVPVYEFAATNIGNYALFAGGDTGQSGDNRYSDIVNSYDINLTKSNISNLSNKVFSLAATNIDGYALFGGGGSNSGLIASVDVYNTALVKSSADLLTNARSRLSATSIGNYALFAGGEGGYLIHCNTVDAYYED